NRKFVVGGGVDCHARARDHARLTTPSGGGYGSVLFVLTVLFVPDLVARLDGLLPMSGSVSGRVRAHPIGGPAAHAALDLVVGHAEVVVALVHAHGPSLPAD